MQTCLLRLITPVPLDQYPQNFEDRILKVQSSFRINFVPIERGDPKLWADKIIHVGDTSLCHESDDMYLNGQT